MCTHRQFCTSCRRACRRRTVRSRPRRSKRRSTMPAAEPATGPRHLDFAPVEELQRAGRWDDAGDLLASEARRLVTAGAELVLLCTNTMHKVADQISVAIDVPLVHIADATADPVRAAGMTRVPTSVGFATGTRS